MEDKPTLYFICGLVASGKTYYAYNIASTKNATVIDSDEYRDKLFGDENCQDNNQKLFNAIHKDIKALLKDGKSVVYSATNLSSKRRRAFVKELTRIPCIKRCIIMATPFEMCLENNMKRQRRVPDDVMWKMYKSWQTPAKFEGWDYIVLEYWNDTYRSINAIKALNIMRTIDQDNPHHKLTLGDHMLRAYELIQGNPNNYRDLVYAASLHDIGKVKCKTYTNMKGERCDHARYYGHENVGAYNVLFYDFYMFQTKQLTLDVSVLINLHMMMYQLDKSPFPYKLHDKYRKIWGAELYDKLVKLHEADVNAH